MKTGPMYCNPFDPGALAHPGAFASYVCLCAIQRFRVFRRVRDEIRQRVEQDLVNEK
jgi:hypothetical protein